MAVTSAINRLNLLALPSLDLRRNRGWGAVDGLPNAPGCYCIVAYLAPRRSHHLAIEERRTVARYAHRLMGNSLVKLARGIDAGIPQAQILYLGYSKDLHARWNSKPHHKAQDLQHLVRVLASLFELVGLRIHFFTCPSGEDANALEKALIKRWQPCLNGMGAIVG